jgi:catechol 2,3-dioxygenase-like lactoylglutathione lyase family enzyme
MFDHIGYGIGDFARSRAFYVAALTPLGQVVVDEGATWAMIGTPGGALLWFGTDGKPTTPIHVAWTAQTRAQVDAFYAAALAAGGRDNGAPGLRPQYSATYYAAFVLDPDGHNIEAVCHAAE